MLRRSARAAPLRACCAVPRVACHGHSGAAAAQPARVTGEMGILDRNGMRGAEYTTYATTPGAAQVLARGAGSHSRRRFSLAAQVLPCAPLHRVRHERVRPFAAASVRATFNNCRHLAAGDSAASTVGCRESPQLIGPRTRRRAHAAPLRAWRATRTAAQLPHSGAAPAQRRSYRAATHPARVIGGTSTLDQNETCGADAARQRCRAGTIR